METCCCCIAALGSQRHTRRRSAWLGLDSSAALGCTRLSLLGKAVKSTRLLAVLVEELLLFGINTTGSRLLSSVEEDVRLVVRLLGFSFGLSSRLQTCRSRDGSSAGLDESIQLDNYLNRSCSCCSSRSNVHSFQQRSLLTK